MRRFLLALSGIACIACAPVSSRAPAPEGAVAMSLLNQPLYAPTFEPVARARMEADLRVAQENAARDSSADALIWLGRRHAYLGEYHQAIQIFSRAVRLYPADARPLRHRGHRFITLRRLDAAIADLEKAARLIREQPDQVEPDGQPNARNIPIGSLHSNVWYHLALAYYLRGDWANAARTAREGMAVSSNPDRLVSQGHWLYMALRRDGRHADATRVLDPVRDDFDIIENDSYFRLMQLYRTGVPVALLDSVMGAGVGSPSNASLAYGLANWFLYSGDTARAVRAFERIAGSEQWGSFGVIAAEADLARLRSAGLVPRRAR